MLVEDCIARGLTIKEGGAVYDFSGGGVTLTGGEALAQPEFAASLLRKVRAQGIHAALSTIGYHNYAVNKYRAMGLEYPLGNMPPASEGQTSRAAEILKRYVETVRIGG